MEDRNNQNNPNTAGQQQPGQSDARQGQQSQQGQQGQQAGSQDQEQGGWSEENQAGQRQSGSAQQQQFDSSGSSQAGGGGMGSRFAEQIREHMEVIGADGQHVGTVDHIDGEQIKLTKSDSDMASGSAQHRYLPLSQVASVEGDKVRLSGSGAGGSGMDQDR